MLPWLYCYYGPSCNPLPLIKIQTYLREHKHTIEMLTGLHYQWGIVFLELEHFGTAQEGMLDSQEFVQFYIAKLCGGAASTSGIVEEGARGDDEGDAEEENEHVAVLSVRAQRKWDELDVDRNGELVGDEVLALAEWVWSSFRPGEAIIPVRSLGSAARITCARDHPCPQPGLTCARASWQP